jgi:hypothetical protein
MQCLPEKYAQGIMLEPWQKSLGVYTAISGKICRRVRGWEDFSARLHDSPDGGDVPFT